MRWKDVGCGGSLHVRHIGFGLFVVRMILLRFCFGELFTFYSLVLVRTTLHIVGWHA